MKHTFFCIKKSIFLLIILIPTFFISVVLLGKYLINQNYSYRSKASENQIVEYNRQLSSGILTQNNAIKRKDIIVKQLFKNPQDTIGNSLLLTKKEVDILKRKNPLYISEMQKKGYMEEYVSEIKGTYSVHIADTFREKSLDTPVVYVQQTDKKNSTRNSFKLFTKKQAKNLQPGAIITLKDALILGSVLYVEEVYQFPQNNIQVLGETTVQSLEYLIIPIYFEEDDSSSYKPPFTKEDIEHEVLNKDNPQSTYNFYLKSSLGKTLITGTVLDWLQIPVSKNLLNTETGFCSYDKWSDSTDNLLDKNPVYAKLQKRIYVFPVNTNCKFILSDTGEANQWAGMAERSGNKIWINGGQTSAVYNHEIGHNIGLTHARQLLCGNEAVNIYDKCEKKEYGDQFDTMGAAYAMRQFNSIYKRNLKWITDENKSTKISSDGVYQLANSDNQAKVGSTLIYKIEKPDTNENYYLELRSIYPFYEKTTQLKIMIHLLHEDVSYLINPNPLLKDLDHSYLDTGDFFYDQINKIYVKVVSIDESTANLEVKFNINSNSELLKVTPQPTPTPTTLKVFISSALYDGNLGGVEGGNKKCQELASSANLKGTYNAILNYNIKLYEALNSNFWTPYYLVTGKIALERLGDIKYNTILTAINITEKGEKISDDKILVYTGYDQYLRYVKDRNCKNWTTNSNKSDVIVGSAHDSDKKFWLRIGYSICSFKRRIYCIQIPE